MSDNPQTNATNRYHKKAYDRLNIFVKKGQKDIIKKYAEETGKSLNKYITDLIYEDMKKRTSDK